MAIGDPVPQREIFEDMKSPGFIATPTMADIDRLRKENQDLTEIALKQEKRGDAFEQQIAQLTLGFTEMGVMIEALVTQLIFDDDHKKKMFMDHINKNRQQMYENINEIARNVDANHKKV